MQKLFSAIVLLCLTLSACSNSVPSDSVQSLEQTVLSSSQLTTSAHGWYSYQNTTFGYSVGIPPDAYLLNKSATGAQIFFGNIPVLTKPKGSEFDIDLYGKTTAHSCDSLGVSKPQVIEDKARGITTQWGRVDVWDGSDREGWQYPKTYITCRKEGTPPPKEVYGLCSEKNGKSVTICINEMTDNPTLAQKIFSTFRWTDQ